MLSRFAMLPLGRRLAIVGGLAAALGGAAAGWLWLRPAPPPPAEAAATADGETGATTAPSLLVFVSGAVVHPGLYHLTASARVADALAAAGGITSAADPGHLPDEAAVVHDGHQVNVPFLGSSSSRRTAATRLDINTASVDELRAVPGMPAGLPEAIVDHRTRWGPFAAVSELRTALGVDRATVTELGRSLRAVSPTP